MNPLDMFDIGPLLGKGGFAVVHSARNRSTGARVALKVIETNNLSPTELKRARREAKVHAFASQTHANPHPNLVCLLDTFEHLGRLYLVLEYCGKGDLYQLLRRGGPLSELQAGGIVKQILHGLQFLHDLHIVHRDLKLSNILLGETGRVKIADFGLAKKMRRPGGCTEEENTVCGTPNYIAPEVADASGNHEHGLPADLFSVGALLHMLLTAAPPFPRNQPALPSGQGRPHLIQSGQVWTAPASSSLSSCAVDVLTRLLQPVPKQRIDMVSLLDHPFFLEQPSSSVPRPLNAGTESTVAMTVYHDSSLHSRASISTTMAQYLAPNVQQRAPPSKKWTIPLLRSLPSPREGSSRSEATLSSQFAEPARRIHTPLQQHKHGAPTNPVDCVQDASSIVRRQRERDRAVHQHGCQRRATSVLSASERENRFEEGKGNRRKRALTIKRDRQRKELYPHNGENNIASGGSERIICPLRPLSAERLRPLVHHSLDGSYIVAVRPDGRVVLWQHVTSAPRPPSSSQTGRGPSSIQRGQWTAASSDGYEIMTGTLFVEEGVAAAANAATAHTADHWLQSTFPEAVSQHPLSYLPKEFWKAYRLLSEATRRLRSRTSKIDLYVYPVSLKQTSRDDVQDNVRDRENGGGGSFKNNDGDCSENTRFPFVKFSMMENGPLPDFIARWSDGCMLSYSLGKDPENVRNPSLRIALSNGESFYWNAAMGASMLFQRNGHAEDEVPHSTLDPQESKHKEQHKPAVGWPRQVPGQVAEHLALAQRALGYCLALEKRALRIADQRERGARHPVGSTLGRSSSLFPITAHETFLTIAQGDVAKAAAATTLKSWGC